MAAPVNLSGTAKPGDHAVSPVIAAVSSSRHPATVSHTGDHVPVRRFSASQRVMSWTVSYTAHTSFWVSILLSSSREPESPLDYAVALAVPSGDNRQERIHRCVPGTAAATIPRTWLFRTERGPGYHGHELLVPRPRAILVVRLAVVLPRFPCCRLRSLRFQLTDTLVFRRATVITRLNGIHHRVRIGGPHRTRLHSDVHMCSTIEYE